MLHAAIQTFRCHSAIDFLAAPVSCLRMRIVQGQRMWLLNLTEHFGPDNSAIATLFTDITDVSIVGINRPFPQYRHGFRMVVLKRLMRFGAAEKATGERCDAR